MIPRQKKPQDVVAWLKTQPHSNAARRECGSEALEPEEMKALASSLDPQLVDLKGDGKKVTLHVKWNLLYKVCYVGYSVVFSSLPLLKQSCCSNSGLTEY